MTSITIALGSNQASTAGSCAEILRQSLSMLASAGATIRAVSECYHTPAFPKGNGPDFVNAAAELSISADFEQVLALLHRVEADLGRVRAQRWGARTVDLDFLAAGDSVCPDLAGFRFWQQMPLRQQMQEAPAQLILPHPRLHERAFVLIPLLDIAPDWRHPVLDMTVRQMVDALPDAEKAEVRRIEGIGL